MLDLLQMHKLFIDMHIKEGDTVVDYTMGNGHDTLYLSKAVGEKGKVYAFDVQQAALDNTDKLLKDSSAPDNYTLILDSHANVLNYVSEPVKVGVFNLGWLPGSDKKITTLRESTLEAVKTALTLIAPDGLLLIAVYPGHEEGHLEGEMLNEYLSQISRYQLCVTRFQIINSPSSPFFFVIERK